MKKLALYLALSISTCFSQNIFTFPFSPDSSRWIYDHTTAFSPSIDKISCWFNKDTLLPNNKSYKPYGDIFYFRQEGSKIYQFLWNDSSEFVRYDFSKQIGDTVSFLSYGYESSAVILTNDHNISVFGRPRRVLTFHSTNGVWDDVADSIGIIDFARGLEDYCQLAGAIISGQIYGDITVVKQNNSIPSKIDLTQNYPNPFNPSTTLQYEIPKAMDVQIIITNVLGQRVALLVNSFKQPGSYQVQWTASNCSSGVYYCTMSCNGFLKTTKLVLLK